MMSLSHWGLFCPPAGLQEETIQYLFRCARFGSPKLFGFGGPGDFCIGPESTWT